MTGGLTRRGRAALIASTLTRVAPVVSELERVWPGLHIPLSTVIDQYVQIARGLTPKQLEWEVAYRQDPPDSLRDLVDSSVETFELATKAMKMVGSTDYKETLLAAEELVEAVDHAASSGMADDRGVAIDSGVYAMAATERETALSQLQKISGESDERLASLLPELIEQSHRIGLEYVRTLRSIGPVNSTKTDRPALAPGTRPAQLLQTLKDFSKRDWKAVESCAGRVDRPRALAAVRDALKVAGIDKSHDLLLEISTTLGLTERGPTWDIVSRALVGAAAWDELDPATRDRLMDCLSDNNHIKLLLETWQ